MDKRLLLSILKCLAIQKLALTEKMKRTNPIDLFIKLLSPDAIFQSK